MASSIRICIEKDNCIYKISSVYLLADGSFKLDVPYCPYKEGFLVKFMPDYRKRSSLIAIDELTQKFTAENRPQLSIHSSGFVQFSGPGILSGIEEKTGMPKGLGVYSAPLITPISSGPTAGITFWGVEFFEKLLGEGKTDLIIKENQLINRFYKEDGILNSYIFEFFVFDERFEKYIKQTSLGEEATVHFPQYPGVFTFPIFRLKNHSSFVGVLPFRINTSFAEEVDFGFNLGGPAGTDTPDGKGEIAVIMAMSEKHIFDADKSLDYKI